MHPSVNMLSYIYDTFKWDHCAESGFDFDDAWTMPSADKRAKAAKGATSSKKSAASKGTGPPSLQESGLPPSMRGLGAGGRA